jgi:hypothetical protein
VTKQSLCAPQRLLSAVELHYLFLSFFHGRENVTTKVSDTFWEWFGKVIQRLRYQRHIFAMWKDGLISELLPRGDVTRLLSHGDPGAFLIRFSEHNPGLFAVAYKIAPDAGAASPQSTVRHYLFKAEEFGTKKSLPDLLRKYYELSNVVRFVSFDNNLNGTTEYSYQNKNTAFSSFYSKVEVVSNASDYDSAITASLAHLHITDHRTTTPGGSTTSLNSPLATNTTSSFKTIISADEFSLRLNELQEQFQPQSSTSAQKITPPCTDKSFFTTLAHSASANTFGRHGGTRESKHSPLPTPTTGNWNTESGIIFDTSLSVFERFPQQQQEDMDTDSFM